MGGEEQITLAALKWSQRSREFFILASEFHKRIVENGEPSDLTASIEGMFTADGKLEPLAVHISTLITGEIEDELEEELDSFFIAGIYRTIFRLQGEQLDWISNEVLGKAKEHT